MRKKNIQELEHSIINAHRDNLGYAVVLKNNETGEKEIKSVTRDEYLAVKKILGIKIDV